MKGVIHEGHEVHEGEPEGPYELPAGWVWTTLGEIAILIGGGTPSRERPDYFGGDIIWLTPTEIPKDRVAIVSESKEHITQEGQRKSSARFVPKGSVLMTSRATIGYVAIAGTDVTTNQGFASFITSGAVDNIYLAYWLWSQRDNFIQQATGTTFKEITKSKLRPISFPLAPLPEQRRIVAKIEELLTSRDAGVAGLKRIQAALKRYRAAVLKAACEGRLVPQDPNDEPAEKLLERILAERRATWEADLRAKGKDPQKAKYEEPKGPEPEGLPELPEGWCWATLDALSQLITSGSRGWSQYYSDQGPLFVRAQDINTDKLELDSVAHVDLPNGVEGARTLIQDNDLLITITGANVTKSALVQQVLPEAYVSQHVGLVRPVEASCSEYIYYWIIAPTHGRRALEKAAYGAGKPGLSLINLGELAIGLAPLDEEHRIVAEVERRLSVISELETTVEANLVRAERLRQAILRRAFEGRLV